jgi:hypothetical protein
MLDRHKIYGEEYDGYSAIGTFYISFLGSSWLFSRHLEIPPYTVTQLYIVSSNKSQRGIKIFNVYEQL